MCKTIISETRFIELFVAAYIFQMFVPHIDRSLLFSRCHVPFLFARFTRRVSSSFQVSNHSNNIFLTKINNCIAQFILARDRPLPVKCHATVMANQDQQVRPQPSEANKILAYHVGTIYGAELQNRPQHSPANQNIRTKEPVNMFHWWLRKT